MLSEKLKVHLEQAYKKLKASVYYDKTQTILRKQIAEFETSDDIEEKIGDMAKRICDDWEGFQEEILRRISIFSFPKKISDSVSKIEGKVIINAPSKNLKVESLNYFIDLPVEGHILGILWVMEVGSILDNELYEKSYGNRLRKEFRDEKEMGNGYSPYLFKHYFEEYESWWSKALDSAKSLMKEEKDALILCMDLSKFYYSVSFSENDFSQMFKKYEETVEKIGTEASEKMDYCYNVVMQLNKFVFNVMGVYGAKLYPAMKKHMGKDKQCLPIGFSPSCILSNYKLKKMDSAILDSLSPVYYGRYVDDFIIVLSIDKTSKVRETIWEKNNEVKSSDILTLYFEKERPSVKNGIHLVRVGRKSSKISEYSIFINDEKTKFKINIEKVQCFYFYSDKTDALIDAFKKHISENVSEFNLMPEEYLGMEKIDQVYNLRRAEASKFRGVEGIEISKFELSKLVGKQITTSNITKDYDHQFLNDSLKIFDEFNILSNYTLWENMFLYYIINDKYVFVMEFIKSILKSLDSITIDAEKNLNGDIKTVNATLKEHFISSLSRALSLRIGIHTRNFLKGLYNELSQQKIGQNWFKDSTTVKEIEDLCRAFYRSGFFDKRLTPILILHGLEIDEENEDVKLYCLEDVIKLYGKVSDADFRYSNYPYMVSPFDIKMLRSLLLMRGGNPTDSKKSEWKQVSKDYCTINFKKDTRCTLLDDAVFYVDSEEIENKNTDRRYSVIKVGNEKKNEFKIAIANTNATKDGLKEVLVGNPERTLKRYNNLAEIVNQAIKGGADMLIFPETYVPFDWLKLLSKKALRNNMSIIAGVEHLKFVDKDGNSNVYNLTATILPFRGEVYRYSFLEFHNKVHYSPIEVGLISGYRCRHVCGKRYEVFCWNDVWFAPYCCYEVTSIKDRSLFQSVADLIVVVECNMDVNYFGSIIESLSRDLHCYCAQVNSAKYGDSRITQPTETERRDIVRTKGGKNHTVIIDKINLDSLRDFQLKEHNLQKEDPRFKYTPPDFDKEHLIKKIKGTWFDDHKGKNT
ncbi:MAG: hypothetical protein FWG96_03720 [Methanomassiliicoccaceae archaeon]|nr:hypothetical protein [Methanomassiliicoccaceae archaeon]